MILKFAFREQNSMLEASSTESRLRGNATCLARFVSWDEPFSASTTPRRARRVGGGFIPRSAAACAKKAPSDVSCAFPQPSSSFFFPPPRFASLPVSLSPASLSSRVFGIESLRLSLSFTHHAAAGLYPYSAARLCAAAAATRWYRSPAWCNSTAFPEGASAICSSVCN